MKQNCKTIGSVLVLSAFLFVSLAPVATQSARRTESVTTSGLIPRIAAVKPSNSRLASDARVSHVVVKFTDESKIRLRGNQLLSETGRTVADAMRLLSNYIDNNLRPLFRQFSEEHLERERIVLQARTGHQLADLNGYFRINVNSATEADRLIDQLNRLENVEIAYAQIQPEPAGDINPPTPDFQPNQDYREAAPAGVDADYVNTLPGGDGTGVKIIDIEGAWLTTHEDLDKSIGGLVAGVMIDDPSWRNHGTAVIGELIAGDNGYGVTGICPGADIGMVSIGGMSTAEAIYTASDNLQAGDLILIELHAPGPHYNFQSRPDQLGYVCMEYWQANFDAMLYAWARGVIVIEAAGNGAEDFDSPGIYGDLFDTTSRNSHAIIAGAGRPAASPSDLTRESFSNYGERVNLQGYGSGVYTSGYGGLFNGGGDENQYYTGTFSGTSSASPIVTGAVACLQGYYKANFGAALTADMARDLLVATGTPQVSEFTGHIGPRPDLRTAITNLVVPPSLYTSPIYFDTALEIGSQTTEDLWLINRSTSVSLDFIVVANDSLPRGSVADWLTCSPLSGTVPPSDSTLVSVTIDAAVVAPSQSSYIGGLEIAWAQQGQPLDSQTTVPVFLNVFCSDSTYSAASSDEPEGPLYDWISAKDRGFKLPAGVYDNPFASDPLDDGTAGPINIGFDFDFYGVSYDKLFIGVNGAISFTDTNVNINGYYASIDIDAVPFATFVCPFWNDLIFDTVLVPEAGLYIFKTLDSMVIEWYHPANFNQFGDTTTNFEIILTRDHNITFQYANVGTSGLEQLATIGISEGDCRALSHFDNGDIPANEVSNFEAVQFVDETGLWTMTGNVNGTDDIDITDIVYFVAYLFQQGPAPIPLEIGNTNCEAGVDLLDLLLIVAYLFNNGPLPCYAWISN